MITNVISNYIYVKEYHLLNFDVTCDVQFYFLYRSMVNNTYDARRTLLRSIFISVVTTVLLNSSTAESTSGTTEIPFYTISALQFLLVQLRS